MGELVIKGRYLTIEEFKKEFKVGDMIKAQGWLDFVVITAIGEKRFLTKRMDNRGNESVSSIQNIKWIKK